jgi:threonine/homoserine/homoserine lactone efflux protein
MDYINLLIIGFIVGLSGAMLPGPMLIYTISKVLQGRIVAGVKIVFGHMVVEVAAIVLILFGLKEIIGSRIVSTILSLIGGIALLVMGLYIIFKAAHIRLPRNTKVNFSFGVIAGGMFFTVFNPTFPTWWATIGAPLLFKALLSGIVGVVMLTIGHWLADLAWFGSVSFAVCKGRPLLNDRMYQVVLRLLGLILVGLGFYLLLRLTCSNIR